MRKDTIFAAPLLLFASAAAAAQPGGRVTVNGMSMYYEVSGRGAPLVVLHGAYMNLQDMSPLIATLARTHRVYAPELQGHGRTTDIDRPMTYENLADDVAGFMDAVGLTKADVFGYSMGALTGLQLSIRHPEKVNKLVFAGGAYDFQGWQPEFRAMIPQQTVEMMLQTPFATEYPRLAANPKGFSELARKVIGLQNERIAWADGVKALRVPVLIIGGDADGATLEHYVQMFRLLGGGEMGDLGRPLPASRLAILPATSHTAIITQADLLQALIDPFLAGVAPKGFLQR
jgi:pimeloyl-ACP methyl ester carboxylesterase